MGWQRTRWIPTPLVADEFDLELIQRYDTPGPRYTSYPTAPHFHARLGAAELAELAEQAASSRAPLSLYVHLPFCASPCFYCGCTRVITRDVSRTIVLRPDGMFYLWAYPLQ